MRKILFPLAIFGILLTMSCEQEAEPMSETINPFVGTWENDIIRYIFTETSVEQYGITRGNILSFSGTYTYNDTHITITTNYREELIQDFERYPNPFVWTYLFREENIVDISIGRVYRID